MVHIPGQVIVVGAGGHGREVAHVLRARRQAGLSVPELIGFADDGVVDEALIAPFAPHLGDIVTAMARHPGVAVLGGVGNGRLRRRLVADLPAASPVLHPLADVGADVRVSDGAVICSHVSVTTNVVLGRHVHLSRGAAIGHDAILEDYVSVMPLAAVSGGVRLDEASFIGTGASIRQGVHIGAGAVVGMGAVVLEDVPPGATVIGNPARELASDREAL